MARGFLLFAVAALALQHLHAQAGRATDAEMIEKAADLEEWGFLDDAEEWYRWLTQSTSEEIRYKAFERWIKLLQKRGKKAEEVEPWRRCYRHSPTTGKGRGGVF